MSNIRAICFEKLKTQKTMLYKLMLSLICIYRDIDYVKELSSISHPLILSPFHLKTCTYSLQSFTKITFNLLMNSYFSIMFPTVIFHIFRSIYQHMAVLLSLIIPISPRRFLFPSPTQCTVAHALFSVCL